MTDNDDQNAPKPAYRVADYLIYNSSSVYLTPLHINKLVFFSHGWNLGILETPLINEDVEAWKYGPIIPSIYYAFKKYVQKKVVPEEYFSTDQNKNIDDLFTTDNKKIMDAVINVYAKKSGAELIAITHEHGSPWQRHYIEDRRDIKIPTESIKDYYAGKARKNESK